MHKLFTSVAVSLVAFIGLANSASAAAFIGVKIEGSALGANAWSNTLDVLVGESYDYRVTFTMAPIGASNSNPAGTTNDTITSYNPSSPLATSNGLNNIKVSVFESAAELVQVDFNSPTLDGSFDEPPGASSGLLTARGNGNDDVIGVASTATAGLFLGVPTANTPAQTLLFTGTFAVTSGLAGQTGLAQVGVQGVVGTFFGMKFNSTATYNGTAAQQGGASPPVAFENLLVNIVPEPTGLGLLALAGAGLIRRRRVA